MTNTVNVEAKVQTIYYETTDEKIRKHYYTDPERLTHDKALELLNKIYVDVRSIVRVITERVIIELPQDLLNNNIIHTEIFYTQTKK